MKNGFGLGYREQVVVDGTIMHAGGSGPRQGKKSTTAIRESQRIRDGEGFMLVNSFNCASIFPPTRKIRSQIGSAGVLGQERKTPQPRTKASRIPQAQPCPRHHTFLLLQEQRKSRASSTAPTKDSSKVTAHLWRYLESRFGQALHSRKIIKRTAAKINRQREWGVLIKELCLSPDRTFTPLRNPSSSQTEQGSDAHKSALW